MEEEIVFTTEDVNRNKCYGILAYIGILVLVPIFAAKDSLYAKFHANQGLVLLIANFALNIIGRIVQFILNIATFGVMSDLINAGVILVTSLFSLFYLITGVINACSGEAKVLPIIGGITLLK